MFFSGLRGRPCLCLVLLLTLTAGCSRSTRAKTPVARLAVLRCENLSGDASLDWMGRAFSEILQAGLSGQAGEEALPLSTLRALGNNMGSRPAAAPGISAEWDAALAAGANRIVTCEVSATGGVLRLAAQVEDTAALRMVGRAQAEGQLSAGIFPISASAARQLGGSARPYGTGKQEAIRAYAEALDASDACSSQRRRCARGGRRS